MSSMAIQLGRQGNTLSKEDLSRALFCAQAVYESVPGAEILLGNNKREYPALSFEKVHMSLDHDVLEGLKFMVAYANDAIFIAFSGTTTPQRLAKTLQMDNHDMKFHAGFFKRANVFMGPGHKNIMHELLSSGKRIIFCGHSSGGAVAHMVLLRILLEDNWIPDENTFLDSMISVAFGAPHVCDKEAARIVNENEKFKWRFINFVNQSDPIPCLLHNPQKIVAAIGGKINCHDDVVVAAIRATFDIGTSHPAGEIRDLLARRVLPPKSTFKTSDQTESDFSPVGYYVFLKRESTEHRDGRYDVHVVNYENTLMQKMLNHLQIKMEDTKHHEI